MSLIQRVTALAQAVAADIKALYAGKAEKEHTHTAAQVSGLGTAATRDVLENDFDNLSPARLLYRGAFGLGAPAQNGAEFYDRVSDIPKATGFYKIKDGHPSVENGKPPLVGGYDSNVIRTTRHAQDYGTDIWLPYNRKSSQGMVLAPRNSNPEVHADARLVSDSLNMYQATGTSTIRTMSQKAISDAITNRGFADASGILTVTSGALSNDMSSYLSSKTYAEMRAKLGVVPVNVVQGGGQSTTDVMSQKSVTDNLDSLGVELDLLRQELDNLKLRLPPEIGDERWGGFYIGDITIPSGDDAGTYMVIMAGEEGESIEKWRSSGFSTVGTDDVNNGMLNTLAMVDVSKSTHPAGKYCVNYRGGGFDDWYMPSINEVALAWDNRALLGGLETGESIHWSSTQTNVPQQARAFNFNTGVEIAYSKTGSIQVRPVRRIKKS